MFEEREFEGKDLEQALHEAAAVLGIPEPELDYKIVEQGRRGLFGVGAKSVRIRVMPPLGAMPDPLAAIEPPKAPALAPTPPPTAAKAGPAQERAQRERDPRSPARRSRRRGGSRRETISEDVDRRERTVPAGPEAPAADPAAAAEVRQVLERMIGLMELEVEVRPVERASGTSIELAGPDRSILIDKEGELLHALQFLLNRMSRRSWPAAGPIVLTCDGERSARRDDELVQQTREVADEVRRTGRAKRLAPMNAYERRLVHLTVREFERLGSRSEGNGHLKRVKIFRQGDA
jgi:spoIIIJ-associated protein